MVHRFILSLSKRTIVSGSVLLVLLIVISFFVRTRWGVSERATQTSARTGPQKKLTDITPIAVGSLVASLKQECPDSALPCILKGLGTATTEHGPTAGINALEALQKDGTISSTEDDHQIAHKIGRKTAEIFGMTGDAFIACPTSYNYGCQHGFFEYALGKAASPAEAADQICGSLGGGYSSKFIFYCYHGVGHGVLMARAYDLQGGLDLCNTLKDGSPRAGCLQGVFMENVNGGLTGTARSGIFSDTDPLAPCDMLDPKYHHECFLNHSGWLMRSFHNSVMEASRACLKAPKDGVEACLQSIGLMVTNPSWQTSLAPGVAGSMEQIAWKLCAQFPPDHIASCVSGAVDNIMNFDELKTDRAVTFCSLVGGLYRSDCVAHIGSAIRAQTTDIESATKICGALPKPLQSACFRGAGV